MKSNYIHVCFVIDESSSMWSSTNDVVGGFNKVLEDQRKIENGDCSISLYTFSDNVSQKFLGKNLDEIKGMKSGVKRTITDILEEKEDGYIVYSPEGFTALWDGVGQAIDEIGEWLSGMPEEERPEKNLIVVMTDGGENSSKKYRSSKVKEMIKHQEEKYSWSFMYLGTDLTNAKGAEEIGIKMACFNTRSDIGDSYNNISNLASTYRNFDASADLLTKNCLFAAAVGYVGDVMNTKYLEKTGIKIEKSE